MTKYEPYFEESFETNFHKVLEFGQKVSLPTGKLMFQKKNLLCGDEVALFGEWIGEKIHFTGGESQGCSLCKGSLGFFLTFGDKSRLEWNKCLDGLDSDTDLCLQLGIEFRPFVNVLERFPNRKTCVMLPFYGLKEFLKGESNDNFRNR